MKFNTRWTEIDLDVAAVSDNIVAGTSYSRCKLCTDADPEI